MGRSPRGHRGPTSEEVMAATTDSDPGPRVRVLTLNLFAHHGDWPRRRGVLADGLRALDADVLLLQEAVVREGYDQVRDLLGAGWHVAHQQRGRVGDGSHHGASVASRWALRAVHEVDLHLTP